MNISKESGIVEKNVSVVINNTGKPICLTIDWIHDLLYWIDIKSNTINVVNIFEPQLNLLLINLDEEKVTTLVVNPMKSVLIWIRKGVSSAIMESFQDGSNIRVLYDNSPASHITVDFDAERYYFIDKNYWTLYSIDFKGDNEQFHIRDSFLSIVNDMSVLNDDLYLSIDEAMVRLPKISIGQKKFDFMLISSKFNDSENFFNSSIKSQKSYRQEIYRVKIVDPLLQPNFTNKCESANCSYLCLPSGNIYGFRCICPTNGSSNLTDCEIHEQNLIVRTTTERITFKTVSTERVMTTYRPIWDDFDYQELHPHLTQDLLTNIITESPIQRTNRLNDEHYNPLHEQSNDDLKTESQSVTESPNKNSQQINNEEKPSMHTTYNIPLMFSLLLIGFFVFSLIMTALIISNFRYNFQFFSDRDSKKKLKFIF
jgi:hypothetical protein